MTTEEYRETIAPRLEEMAKLLESAGISFVFNATIETDECELNYAIIGRNEKKALSKTNDMIVKAMSIIGSLVASEEIGQ